MTPQFTYDTKGNAIGVFLPIEDWDWIQTKLPIELEELPQWQKNIIDHRMALIAHSPDSMMPLEEFIAEMEKEVDEAV